MSSTRKQTPVSKALHPKLQTTTLMDAEIRITQLGLLANLGMAIGKGIGGYVFHSQALMADGFHSLTDLVTDLITLFAVSFSLKPPTARFPSGYGKVESLGALVMSTLLLFGGVAMAWNALYALYEAAVIPAHGLETHGLGHGMDMPDLNAAWVAAGSILVKEWLYRETITIARERKSAVLASNAMHHRIDSLTSVVALMTIGGARVSGGASLVDPLGALLLSVVVMRAGWANTKASLLETCDVSINDDVRRDVREAATRAIEGNGASGPSSGDSFKVREVQGTKSGQSYLVDINIKVPGACTVQQIGTVEETVRERVGTVVQGVRRVKLRFTSTDGFRNELVGYAL